MTRAFVAVVPPPPVLDAVERATSGIDFTSVRRTTRAQWHLTLQFLGDVGDLDGVAAALAPLSSVPNLGGTVRLGGGGAFPKVRRAQVLWIGAAEGREVLTALAGAVAARLALHGLDPEDRPFHPHLTLGRMQKATDLRAPIAQLDACDFGPAWIVEEVVLYESRLLRTGAEYVPRAVIRLRI